MISTAAPDGPREQEWTSTPGDRDVARRGKGRAVLSEEQKRVIRTEFTELANMAPGKLERWLASPESKAIGAHDDGLSHRAGERIVVLKRTRMQDLLESDYAQMEEISRYLQRRIANPPGSPSEVDRWRCTMRNWGHDPLA